MKGLKTSLTMAAAVMLTGLLMGGCNSEDAAANGEEISAPQPGAETPDEPGLLTRMGLKEPEPVVVPAGTRIRVRTTSTLSTKSNNSGESFVATVAEPVTIDGRTVFAEGARAQGVVSLVDKSGRVKGLARIGAQLTEIEDVAVNTKSYVVVADKTYGKDATKIGVGAGVGAAIGALAGGGGGAAKGAGAGAGAGTGAVLATRGDPAVIPAESLIWFELESPVTVR
jgi:hypothetical protein